MLGRDKLQRILEKLVRFLNRKTLYPLILGPWKNIHSPILVQEVINTGYFRDYTKPYEPDLSNIKDVIVIAPHQDDEAIGCGGLLFKLKDQANITVIFVTDGSQNNLGISPEESIQLRNEEAIKSVSYFKGKSEFLGLPNNNLKVDSSSIDRLKLVLAKYNPDLILTPWLFDRPKKHRITNLLLFNALQDLTKYHSVPLWSYQVHNVIFPNIVIDITDVKDFKEQMIQEYHSQLKKVAPYDHYILGMNQWNAQYLPLNRNGWAEVFFGIPTSDWLNIYLENIKDNKDTYITSQ